MKTGQGLVEYALTLILILVVFLVIYAVFTTPPHPTNEFCKTELTGFHKIGQVDIPDYKTTCITPAPTLTPDVR